MRKVFLINCPSCDSVNFSTNAHCDKCKTALLLTTDVQKDTVQSSLIICKKCLKKISARAAKCPHCQSDQKSICQICGQSIPVLSEVCPECGDPDPFHSNNRTVINKDIKDLSISQLKQLGFKIVVNNSIVDFSLDDICKHYKQGIFRKDSKIKIYDEDACDWVSFSKHSSIHNLIKMLEPRLPKKEGKTPPTQKSPPVSSINKQPEPIIQSNDSIKFIAPNKNHSKISAIAASNGTASLPYEKAISILMKIVLSVVVFLIGSVIAGAVRDVLGGGFYIISGLIVMVLIYIWSRPSSTQ